MESWCDGCSACASAARLAQTCELVVAGQNDQHISRTASTCPVDINTADAPTERELRAEQSESDDCEHAPRLPQPPAKALAVPTTLGLNMQELQNWQHTKQASAKPMAQRVMMNVAESVTMDMAEHCAQARVYGVMTGNLISLVCIMAEGSGSRAQQIPSTWAPALVSIQRAGVSWLTGC